MDPFDLLKKAIAEQDGDLVEEALYSDLSTDYNCVELLLELFESEWHCRHEDIVSLFQKIRYKAATAALHRTISKKYQYLEYNDSEELHRKCIWALADFGDEESFTILKEMAAVNNKYISTQATERLENWKNEFYRKANLSQSLKR